MFVEFAILSSIPYEMAVPSGFLLGSLSFPAKWWKLHQNYPSKVAQPPRLLEARFITIYNLVFRCRLRIEEWYPQAYLKKASPLPLDFSLQRTKHVYIHNSATAYRRTPRKGSGQAFQCLFDHDCGELFLIFRSCLLCFVSTCTFASQPLSRCRVALVAVISHQAMVCIFRGIK